MNHKTTTHNTKHLLRAAILLAALLLCPAVWGQTDYSGTYYIRSESPNKNTQGDYYMCPTKGWYLYTPTNSYEDDTDNDDDNGKPFLTTYQCKDGVYDASKAVWTIVKHPSEENCYYIIQTKTGRYMVSNGQIGTSSYRMRVHLDSVADAAALSALGDLALFEITTHSGHIDIVPHATAGRVDNTYKYIVVNFKNFNELAGSEGKQGGPNNSNTAGIIGLYNQEDNHKWYLEKATVDPPIITNNKTVTNTFTIAAETGATIYYTTDGTTPTISSYSGTGTTSVNVDQTESMTVIKAIAKATSDYFPSIVTTYNLPVCEKPVITAVGGIVTITCATEGAAIHYTKNDDPATSSSTTYTGPFAKGSATTFRAVATKAGYVISSEAILLPPTEITSSNQITDMTGNYKLLAGFSSVSSIGTSENPFKGIIDGNMVTISGLNHPLVAYAEGATIKNVIVDNVTISSGTNVGAICGEATGDSRIYNCGVLATGSTVTTDEDGYTKITSCSSTISGSNYVGGIVGLLDGTSRVINCFSYANITGGAEVGGIVGHNNVATTATNLKTMVMNCMFYGEVSGTSIAPIYNGTKITNVGENTGVSNFNYFRLESAYIQNTAITKVYNCALGAETRFLQRFEFYRHLLNSNRELAGWWATGSYSNGEMMKWVLEPTQIGTTTPYPILKTPGKYASVVNYTPNETAYDEAHRNEGRKQGTLDVTIRMGSGGAVFGPPTGAAITNPDTTLIITDKDPDHFNFNYYKVQLPYYNEVGTKNYNGNRVVTGWKIVSITGGTDGTFTGSGGDVTYDVSGNISTMPYNFADRNCTNKDLYDSTETAGSDRIFNQGAYWDVPEGVTAITIEPYWAKCAYVADENADVVYNDAMTTLYNVPNVGGGSVYTNGNNYSVNGQSQIVYTSIINAISWLSPNTSHTVNDYAVVLVGNYHQYQGIDVDNIRTKPYTVTSIDLDKDNEPDYSFILRFDGRTRFHPVKYDFVDLIGFGMAQKSTTGNGSYNFGIPQPIKWFEVTNTALFRVTQLEYERDTRSEQPLILHGGVIEQWVSGQNNGNGNKTTYIHVGGNVWFKEFHLGCHQDKTFKTKHPPVSVNGGDFDAFYLTGLYAAAENYEDDAECYINGGRFGTMAGTGMEGIGKTSDHTKGNITWIIDNADIKEFYAGGINASKINEGNINTIISNSRVNQYCGGPKFGDMNSGRTVTTTATNCKFGTYFGAGYGGNSYYRAAPRNFSEGKDPWWSSENHLNLDWNRWINGEIKAKTNNGNYANGVTYSGYKQDYISQFGGVSVGFDYQFLPMSDNLTNVARLFIDFIKFSLATTRNVTSNLKWCTITGNFYGGGSLGKVEGSVTSTLDSCTVGGNVFGAGFSASLPPVEVDSIGFREEPYYYTALGTYRTGVKGSTTTYKWKSKEGDAWINKTDSILYTTEDLDDLGTVKGNVTLILKGNTKVGTMVGDVLKPGTGNVFGGGDMSGVTGGGNTTVTLQEGVTVHGNVYGGGNEGAVSGSSRVLIQDQEIQNN